jgi:putative membrane-bound dehydrogenase-like protein
MRRTLSLLSLLIPISPALAQREFGFDNTKPSGQPYLKPEESLKRMKVADGFEVKLFAAEPDVVNPIAMTVDEKGRVWVIECFEYPKRTAKGMMPRDRIVILEDTDGDGICDKRTVFAEGKDFPVPFDLASGLEVGYGGVYVGAPPYLFFIENKNDKPGKFEILLKGFGSQDTHETLNTFKWGPDGWLYGLHGVFTHSEVKPAQADGPGTRLNAGVWRFHPKTKKFEVFAEGTSNPWGMDWRNTDGQFILCCCVIPHLYHIVPGGIYKRQAGTSFNPYAYGEIKEICDHTFHKESGWAHAGLISLDTPLMPEKYRNSVIFGSIHGCSIKQNILKPNGSSYIASRGDDFLVSGDKNFRPINLRWGPNGEIYCIDWHDQNPCHQAAPNSWDYEHGRVYRIQPKGLKTKKAEDLGKYGLGVLIQLIADPNPYRMRTALRLMRERYPSPQLKSDLESIGDALKSVSEKLSPIASTIMFDAIHGLNWGLPDNVQDLSDDEVKAILSNFTRHADISLYIRLASTSPKLSRAEMKILAAFATRQSTPAIRRECASLAARTGEAGDTTLLLHLLVEHKEDSVDPVIPQLLWTAYEKQLTKSPTKELDWLRDNVAGNALITDTIIPRTMRRLAATGKADDLAACVAFIGAVKDPTAKVRGLEGLTEAFKGRLVDGPANWKEVRATLEKDASKDVQALVNKLAVSFRDPEAVKRSLAIATDAKASIKERIDAIRDLALARPDSALQPLLKIARSDEATELRAEAIRALASFEDPQVANALLAEYGKLARNLKGEVVNVLAGRKEWARALLDAVGAKKVERTDLTDNTILRIQALKDKNLDAQIDKVWGRLRSTPAELNELINKTRGQLYEARASFERGKIAFDTHCAKCHKFDGRGHEVGPPLDGAGRDIEYLLVNVLDPNRVIGAPYFMRTVRKLNGQTEQGVLHAEDEQTITLKTENAVLKVIPKNDIESIKVQEKSLMPEGFGNNLKIQEFRDLIRYVMADPFITEVEVVSADGIMGGVRKNEKPLVGVTGRIPIADGELSHVVHARVIAPDAMKAILLVGIRNNFEVLVNNSVRDPVAPKSGKGSGVAPQPDQAQIEVDLKKGENTVTIRFRTKGKGEAIYARFHDPDRKLRYPEPPEEKTK